MVKYLYWLLSLLLLLLSFTPRAQPDTVRPGNGVLQTRRLKPGLRQYLLCYGDSGKPRTLGFWYWLRDVRMEQRDGQNVIAITQRWYGSDTSAYREVYSTHT